jgi:glucosyl-3-phosphoglycerate synthase
MRTFYHQEFRSERALKKIKDASGVTIACVIPTLNEAATVAKVIGIAQRSALIDDVYVIDSESTDQTRYLAGEAGAFVYRASEIRADLPPAVGKGENLWKSLWVTNHDILIFLDADVKNVAPHFVRGLLGPLLQHAELGYIKSYYLRPDGGGRVTELLVKPWFRHYYPELAALHQPLSGEYAVRRALLERLPFPVGYGVEAAHLIDLHQSGQLSQLAQVDLGVRRHRARPLTDLTLMSDAILGAMVQRRGEKSRHAQLERGRKIDDPYHQPIAR